MKKIIVRLNLIKLLSVFFYIFRIFPIKKNKIVFVNFSGKGFGDNAKYIYNELNKQNEKYDFVWLVRGDNYKDIPTNIRTVKIFSILSFYELATAKIWINNSRFDQFVVKRKNQFYIQTWHGGLALKKIEYDAEDKLSQYYKKVMKNDNKMIDLMISNSTFCTNMYKNGFKYSGEILEKGSPRNDILINNNYEIIKKVKLKYGITDEKVLLYAPTFRNDYKNNPYDIDFENLINKLEKVTNQKWKVMIKLHPRITDASKYIDNINKFINVTSYSDIQELINLCDLLITDYSSTMFEAMIAKKPVIIYANDFESYNNERGVYFNFKELPFPLSQNNKQLYEIIEKFNYNCFLDNYIKFSKVVGLNETGTASLEIANIIKKHIQESK